jgi:hypothetical protein
MQNSPKHLHRLSLFAANLNAIHDFVKKSMKEKRQVIAEGLSNFKEGLVDAFTDGQSYVNLLSLPVNNFLKDISQMDRDFEEELKKNSDYCICLNGKMIPANEVLTMPMEENY